MSPKNSQLPWKPFPWQQVTNANFQAHKFLESLGETLTVIALRERLRKIDMDLNGKMALLEYMAFKYSKSVPSVVASPQGSNPLEIKKAGEKLDQVSKNLETQRVNEENMKKAEGNRER